MIYQDLITLLENRSPGERLCLQHEKFEDMDLSGLCLSNIDLKKASFINVRLMGADLSGCDLEEVFLEKADLRDAKLTDCHLRGADLRFADLRGADISGSYLFGSVLENALLQHVRYDERTKFFQLYCPAEGAFVGYKKCFNDRIVQLLIPKDAKRTSATMNTCRCDKAKVLSIRSLDGKQNFREATSYVDENFVYRVGEYVIVEDFNEDRWFDSTTGIHFWLTREEAAGYM